ncbi:hypothetical protein BZG02_18350 [Labilibaculum filiforme]|uniref:Competence protein ComEA n=1 Tax=Labilibaculum filiforme TaxID=1940526 RepID=A0A2N3HRJ5_9BACT|nr:helix-hairpin-helix domain-containing protein [Labilibaculum filiforme]PKQ60685.1 hypothetical protein BZG02_18350 [Labilibaculum filiforme]
MNFKHTLREYFSYSSSEKNGLLVLVFILLVLYFLPVAFTTREGVEDSLDQKRQFQIDSVISVIENRKNNKEAKIAFTTLSYFDPNTVGKEELIGLGFTSFQISNLIKFRNKGGLFKKKTDLLKIYGIETSDLERWNLYIHIVADDKGNNENRVSKTKSYSLFPFDPNLISLKDWERLGVNSSISVRIKKYLNAGGSFKHAVDLKKIYGFDSVKIAELIPYVNIVAKVDHEIPRQNELLWLNSADTNQLKQLPGIGSVLSTRIVKYRDMLGGFVVKAQLQEVYGLSRDKYTRIATLIRVDSLSVRKIEINSIEESRLKKHPYINARMAKDIVRYRDRNGNFTSLKQLRSHKLVADSLFLKLVPYLELK